MLETVEGGEICALFLYKWSNMTVWLIRALFCVVFALFNLFSCIGTVYKLHFEHSV